MRYEVNKGVGAPLEFLGLRSQYLYIVVGGLFLCFLLVVLMISLGMSYIPAVGIAVGIATLILYVVTGINRKYGPHGLMKVLANRRHPDYLSNRVRVKNLLRNDQHK